MDNRGTNSLDSHQKGNIFSKKMFNFLWSRKFSQKKRKQLKPHDYERHLFQEKTDTSPWYLFYRWIQFASFVVVCIYSIINGNKYAESGSTRWKWLIYLTNWGYSVCTTQSFLAMAIVQLALINKTHTNDGRTKIPMWYKLYHALFATAIVTASTITIMYWSVVHNPSIHKIDAINVLVHAGNSVAMYIDLMIVRIPWRMKHVIWPVLCGFLYSIFSFAYYALGGTDRNGNPYVYSSIDWRRPGRAIGFCCLSMSMQAFIHCTIYVIYKLRKKCMKKVEDDSSSTNPLTLQEKPILVTISS